MSTRCRRLTYLIVLVFLTSFLSQAFAQKKDSLSTGTTEKLTLVQAAMCEGIEDNSPKNRAIVFPFSIGRVHCFTTFDPVPAKTVIYHKWYFRDKLRARVKLSLRTPRWATFSRIGLRDGEKGPWRVEITDEEENILRILRFSVTD
ncbi:MAG: DUF2914 domain-containing protein [Desulfobacteraceae bacterium]